MSATEQRVRDRTDEQTADKPRQALVEVVLGMFRRDQARDQARERRDR